LEEGFIFGDSRRHNKQSNHCFRRRIICIHRDPTEEHWGGFLTGTL
jgi:hypothetical protein